MSIASDGGVERCSGEGGEHRADNPLAKKQVEAGGCQMPVWVHLSPRWTHSRRSLLCLFGGPWPFLLRRCSLASCWKNLWFIWLAAGWLAGAPLLPAATFVVTNLADTGSGTLREAMNAANSTAGTNRIEFGVRGWIALNSPLASMSNALIIAGPGATNLTIGGNLSTRVFSIESNTAVTLSGLTIADGKSDNSGGGGILNQGILVMEQCILTNNFATNQGGGILNRGTFTAAGCTFVNNTAGGVSGLSQTVSSDPVTSGEGAVGGAICSAGSAGLTNCTFSGNLAIGGRGGDSVSGTGLAGGGVGLGGALFILKGDRVAVVNCTITSNSASGGLSGTNSAFPDLEPSPGLGYGGGFGMTNSTVMVEIMNTILAGNRRTNGYDPTSRGVDGYGSPGTLVSWGGNLLGYTNGLSAFTATNVLGMVTNGTPGFASSDQINVSNLSLWLGPLQDNGGPTPTRALLATNDANPAIDRGISRGSPAQDQRGVIRPQGQGVDVGAYELGNQTIRFPAIPNHVYGDPPFLVDSSSSSGLSVASTIVIGPAYFSPTNSHLLIVTGAGPVTVVASQPGDPPLYLPAPPLTNSFTIAPAPLIVTATDTNRPYGATILYTGLVAGVVYNDNISYSFQSAATPATPVGTYGTTNPLGIIPTAFDPDGKLVNYSVTINTGTLTITKAASPITVTANNANRGYGKAAPIFSGTIIGVLNGDDITATFQSAATLGTPVGVYGPASSFAIKPILLDPDGRLINYNVVTNNGTLIITKAGTPIVATAYDTNRAYGQTNPVLTGAPLTGILNGDNITVSYISAAITNTPVGIYGPASSYAIKPKFGDPDGKLVNYTVTTNNGTLTITKAILPIIAVAHDASRRFGETNPIFSGTLSNVLNGDRITASFISAATISTPVAIYPPTSPFAIEPVLSDPDHKLANYDWYLTNGTLTITPSIAPAVNLINPTNGAIYLAGQDLLLLAGLSPADALFAGASFFSGTNLIGPAELELTNARLTLSNLVVGTKILSAQAVVSGGQTYFSTNVTITVIAELPMSRLSPIDTNSIEVRQTGLYMQDIWVTNITPLALPGFRLEVRNLPANVSVWNATGTSNGAPFLQYNFPVPAGAVPTNTIKIRIEYYSPSGAVPVPSFAGALAHPSPPLNLTNGTPLSVRGLPFTNGMFRLKFNCLTNRQYYIQYTSTLTNWNTVLPPIMGRGNAENWLDTGPPQTESLPSAAVSRFYRLLLMP